MTSGAGNFSSLPLTGRAAKTAKSEPGGVSLPASEDRPPTPPRRRRTSPRGGGMKQTAPRLPSFRRKPESSGAKRQTKKYGPRLGEKLRFLAPAGASWIPAFAGMTRRELIPARRASHRLRSPHPLRGVIARRRAGGMRCGACGPGSQAKAPGRLGAPSGLTTKPCQELADRPALRRQRKAGPAADQRRVWRAERRPPWSVRIADTIGLRFSARRSPLILRRAEGPSSKDRGIALKLRTLTRRGKDLSCPRSLSPRRRGAGIQ